MAASRFVYNPGCETAVKAMPGVTAGLLDAGTAVQGGTVANAAMAGSGGRYNPVTVEASGPGEVTVGTGAPFAHIDEFGSVNSGPTAAMRRAAESVGGRFEPS